MNDAKEAPQDAPQGVLNGTTKYEPNDDANNTRNAVQPASTDAAPKKPKKRVSFSAGTKQEKPKREPVSYAVVAIFAFLFAAIAAVVVVIDRRQFAAAVERETPVPSDVLLASFPKSGSHWARFLVAELLRGSGKAPLSFEAAEALIPDLELGPNRRRFAPPRTRAAFWPRVYKSHQPYLAHPVGTAEHQARGGRPCGALKNVESFQCLCPNCPARWRRIVYVVRDGRSALCSYYAFQRQLGNFDGTYAEFLASDKSQYGYDWADHALSYANATADVFFLRYEALKDDPVATLRGLLVWLKGAAFSNTVDDARLEAIVEASSLARMKAAEAATGTPLFDGLYPGARARGFQLVREGKVDGWRACDDADYAGAMPNWSDARSRLGYNVTTFSRTTQAVEAVERRTAQALHELEKHVPRELSDHLPAAPPRLRRAYRAAKTRLAGLERALDVAHLEKRLDRALDATIVGAAVAFFAVPYVPFLADALPAFPPVAAATARVAAAVAAAARGWRARVLRLFTKS